MGYLPPLTSPQIHTFLDHNRHQSVWEQQWRLQPFVLVKLQQLSGIQMCLSRWISSWKQPEVLHWWWVSSNCMRAHTQTHTHSHTHTHTLTHSLTHSSHCSGTELEFISPHSRSHVYTRLSEWWNMYFTRCMHMCNWLDWSTLPTRYRNHV